MSFNFKKIYSTPFFDIEEGLDLNYIDTEPYYRLTGLDSVICFIITMDGKFVMVRQFRPVIGEFSLEFPAGELMKGEQPLDAAKRELFEETSLTTDLIYLGEFRLMMNRTNIKEHIFFGIISNNITQYAFEKGLELELVSRQDLLKLSISGGYKHLAGLGIIQLASNYLGLNIMNEKMEIISKKFESKLNK